MTAFIDINAALETKLSTISGSPDIAWENIEYTPTNGTLFLRPTNIPGDVDSYPGVSGLDMHIGIFQVDVFTDAGISPTVGLQWADTVADLFKAGTEMTYNSRTVKTTRVSRRAAIQEGGWYQIPVEITYLSFTTART